jgi:hypothetical protein
MLMPKVKETMRGSAHGKPAQPGKGAPEQAPKD